MTIPALRAKRRLSSYFGRPKTVNAAVSATLFFALRARLASQRLLNRVRHRGAVPTTSNAVAAAQLARLIAEGYRKLNLGGGGRELDGFVNIDFVKHPSVMREVVADITDLSFVPTGQLVHVHSNHVFEHLDDETFGNLVVEVARALQPGGLLTFRGPNALGVCFGFFFGEVLESDRAGFLAAGFPPDEAFSDSRDRWYQGDVFALLHWLFGNPGKVDNQHLQLLTPTECRRVLEEHGFEILKMSEPEATNIAVVARKR